MRTAVAFFAAILAVGAVAPSLAKADTIEFGTYSGPDGSQDIGGSYTEDGINFASADFIRWQDGSLYDADPTSSTGLVTNPGAQTVVTNAGGGSFSLISMDVTDAYNGNSDTFGELDYSYTFAGGSNGSGSFNVPHVSGYSTLILNLVGLSSFTLSPSTNLSVVQFDNFVVADVVAATPIPAALPLFASALSGLGFVGWRRKMASAA